MANEFIQGVVGVVLGRHADLVQLVGQGSSVCQAQAKQTGAGGTCLLFIRRNGMEANPNAPPSLFLAYRLRLRCVESYCGYLYFTNNRSGESVASVVYPSGVTTHALTSYVPGGRGSQFHAGVHISVSPNRQNGATSSRH